MATEMVIFSRMFDLLDWLLPKAERFPRVHRNTLTPRLMNAALDTAEALYAAEHGRDQERLASLRAADVALDRLRLYLRLAHRWQWLSHDQYGYASRMVEEVGRLLGGWLRQTRASGRGAGG